MPSAVQATSTIPTQKRDVLALIVSKVIAVPRDVVPIMAASKTRNAILTIQRRLATGVVETVTTSITTSAQSAIVAKDYDLKLKLLVNDLSIAMSRPVHQLIMAGRLRPGTVENLLPTVSINRKPVKRNIVIFRLCIAMLTKKVGVKHATGNAENAII